MSTRPAELLHQRMGRLEPGYPADIALVELEKPFMFDKNASASKARNTPYHGWMLRGQVKMTLCDGKVVFPW